MKHVKVTSRLAMVFCLFVLGPSMIASAQTDKRYVTDMIILTLREGPGNEYNVIRTLKSDTPVYVLEEGEAFTKIRTEDNQEGWVAKQYLTESTPKPIIIAGLKKEIEELNARIARLAGVGTSAQSRLENQRKEQNRKREELENNLQKWKQEALNTKRNLDKITQEHDSLLEASSNVTELVVERDQLKEKNSDLENTIKDLQAKVGELQEDHDRLIRNEILHWFLAGSGVFFVGLIIGKLSRKKKRF